MPGEQENTTEGKKAMKDANTVGWVLYLLLVIGIGAGTNHSGSEMAWASSTQASAGQAT